MRASPAPAAFDGTRAMTLVTRPLRLATLAFALSLGLAACGGDGSLPSADTAPTRPVGLPQQATTSQPKSPAPARLSSIR
jgi:hypothetical protein